MSSRLTCSHLVMIAFGGMAGLSGLGLWLSTSKAAVVLFLVAFLAFTGLTWITASLAGEEAGEAVVRKLPPR